MVIRVWQLAVAVAALAVFGGCANDLDALCPKGTKGSGSRCLPEQMTGVDPLLEAGADADIDSDVDAAADHDAQEPDQAVDSAQPAQPSMDAATAADALLSDVERGQEEDAATRDATAIDARVESDAPLEAGAPGDTGTQTDADTTPNGCPDVQHTRWRKFQMSGDVVPTIGACYQANPTCVPGVCSIAPCLQAAAHVEQCTGCVAAEVDCASKYCPVQCSILTDDDACRACACAQGCLSAPGSCGVGDGTDACADCVGSSCSTHRADAAETITVPLFFHLLKEGLDPATNLPAYSVAGGGQETILDVDARLAEANTLLEAARSDGRRVQLIRVGMAYVSAPPANTCPDPVEWTGPKRFYGALNIALTGETACPGTATTAFAARASAATLLRVVGSMLGIPPEEQLGSAWQVTREQLVRMHNYARWRLGAADAVPQAERPASMGFMYGPADPIWDKPTNRDWALTNASLHVATAMGRASSLPLTQEFAIPATRATRRVLGVRVRAHVSGTPSDKLRVIVSTAQFQGLPISRSAVSVQGNTLLVEDAFDSSSAPPLHDLLRRFPGGKWKVGIDDSADLVISDLRLEVITGDRNFLTFDRHARGSTDILVYRPSTSELLSAPNPTTGTTGFGAITRDPVPTLPQAGAKLMVGDVDGDGTVDLTARHGASVWVSFFKGRFQPWREGSIAGSDRPNQSDEVLMGDLDGDGFGDLMRRRLDFAGNRSLWATHRGVGDGSFEAARAPLDPPTEPEVSWTLADVYHKGRSDLFFRDHYRSLIIIKRNDTAWPTTTGSVLSFYGGWGLAIDGSVFPASDRIILLDVDGDGYEDLVAYRPSTAEWFTHLDDGRVQFGPRQRLTLGGSPTSFTPGDVVLNTAP